jgi:hypothetical protein
VLELVHTAGDRSPVLRAEARVWQNVPRVLAARRAAAERDGARVMSFGVGDGPAPPSEIEHRLRLWLQRPDRFRSERDDAGSTTVTVADGSHWWRFAPGMGALREDAPSSIAAGGLGELSLLVSPSRILGVAVLEAGGETSVAGGRGLVARATPPPLEHPDLGSGLAMGARHHDLVVDAERGVLLVAQRDAGGDRRAITAGEPVHAKTRTERRPARHEHLKRRTADSLVEADGLDPRGQIIRVADGFTRRWREDEGAGRKRLVKRDVRHFDKQHPLAAVAALKSQTELLRDRVWRTRTQLEPAIVEYAAWFNNDRLRESLGDIAPAESETLCARRYL